MMQEKIMDGLFKKYHITKTDGEPIPPEDKFMVLRYNRLNSSWDNLCRFTLHIMCVEIISHPETYPDLQEMAKELKLEIEELHRERER